MMKKVLFFSTALLLGGSCAHAQRLVDLQATLVAPATGATITSGQQFSVNVTVKNAGTTQLKATDTVAVIFYINNTSNILKDGSGNPIGASFTNQVMNPNDTKSVPLTLTITHNISGQQSFCAVMAPINRSADSVKDNSTANNVACNNVTFAGATSVGQVYATVSKHSVSAVYPNPASGAFGFDVKMGENAVVDVKLVDLAGRVVLAENRGQKPAGEHSFKFNPGNIPGGIYLYEVKIGDEKFHGKLTLR